MDGPKRERRTSRRVLVTIAVAATALMTAGVLPARATAPGKNGRIAFRRYFNDEQTLGAIFTIRPNSTGLVQLTHRGKVLLDTDPDWSPDGRWIVFNRVKVGVYSRMFKMRSDGTHLTRLDPSCMPANCEDLYPAWSPDGQRIAYLHVDYDTGTDSTFVMRPDGTHVRMLPDGVGGAWSPDGKRMAMGRDTDRGTAAFTIALDGTHARRITPWKLQAAVYDWSPDGRWILILSHGDKDRQRNVYLVHPNGRDLHRVTNTFTHGESNWGGLSFSPDGTMIAASHRPGVGTAGNPDIWVMNLDGSGLRDVTNSVIFDSSPDWGPRPTR